MIRFGTDGIRGRAGRPPVDGASAAKVGSAAGRLAQDLGGTRVLVARDTRPSGPSLRDAVVRGIVGSGAIARDGGVVPTSAVAAALAAGVADVGVMITASHNAAEDNGFKVLAPGGRKLGDAEIAQVERWLLVQPSPSDDALAEDAARETFEAYTRALSAALPDLAGLTGLRIALDLANGAASGMGPWLQRNTPAIWELVAAGDGPINEDCGAVHPERLAAVVVERGCSAGIALDGDADRCVLVDERGQVVPGDALAWLLTTGRRATALAVTVMSNAALEPSLPGVRVVRTPVGDRHLLEALARGDAQIGCEESGHVVFDDGLPTGDGLLTGLRGLACAAVGGQTLSAATAGFTPFPRRLTKVIVASRPPLDEVVAVQQAVRQGEQALGVGGRIFLRYSGTEPVLRILVEGADDGVVGRVCATVTQVATEVLG